MSTDSIQKEIIEEFSFFEDWAQKYEYIIEMGKSVPPINPKFKIEENKVKGCQSHVWLYAEMDGDKMHIEADSDALIVKGLVGLLLRIYNNRTPEEVISLQPDFIDAIGMKAALSPTRSNGLASMIKQIKAYAMAYKVKSERK